MQPKKALAGRLTLRRERQSVVGLGDLGKKKAPAQSRGLHIRSVREN
jgi:hypothetical protein